MAKLPQSLLLSLHHHDHHDSLATSGRPQPPITARIRAPSLLRVVGSKNNSSIPSEARTPPQLPLPFSKGCGPLILTSRWNWGRTNARGYPISGRPVPVQCVAKTGYDICHGPFLFIPTPNPSLTISNSTARATPTITATTTRRLGDTWVN